MEDKVKNQGAYNDIMHENMCLIPAGKFLMGAEGWGNYEGPIHEIFIDDFLMDEYPVTNQMFSKFVEETGYKTTAENKGYAMGYEKGEFEEIQGLNWRTYATKQRANHPVVLVSWYDANDYAKWINKRLPTEAEWEKAARGGLIGKLYPWGDDEAEHTMCNFAKTTVDLPPTTAVKSFTPNGYGLYDMCGNVWNWCFDWFSENYYSSGENKNPQGPETGLTKIRRGASFNIMQTFRLRTSNRGAYDPNDYAINIGFRCVKDFK